MRWASPPGEGRGLALEGEVVEPDVLHEGEPGVDLLEDLPRDLLRSRRQSSRSSKNARASRRTDRQRDLVDVRPADGHGEDLGLQARAAAGLALLLRHEAFQPLLDLLASWISR